MDLINYVNLSNYYSNEFYLFEIFLILSYVFVVTGTIFYLKLLRDSYMKNTIKRCKIQLFILRNFIEKSIFIFYQMIFRKIFYNNFSRS